MFRWKTLCLALVLSVLSVGCDRFSAGSKPQKATWYVNLDSGFDGNDGRSEDSPLEHAPGDPAALEQAAGYVLQRGDTILFTVGDPDQAPWTGNRRPRHGRRISVFQCVKPSCGYQMRMTNDQAKEAFGKPSLAERRAMGVARMVCEHCRDRQRTSVKAMQCPKCGFWFASPIVVAKARRAMGMDVELHHGPVLCPNCNVDVDVFWNKHRTQRE